MYKFDIIEYMDLLERIVNINSYTSNYDGINKVSDILKEVCEMEGLFTKEIRLKKAGKCLEVSNIQSDKYDVMLLGHMDTVFPEDKATKPTIDGDEYHAQGSADMKGGLVCMYYVLKYVHENKLPIRVVALFNSDEEIGSPHSKHLIEELAVKSECALVFEAMRPDGGIVIKRKGVGRYNINIEGIASHSGTKQQNGRNALVEAANWVVELDKLTDYKEGTTVNIGRLTGGIQHNIVADQASIDIGFRVWNMAEYQKIKSKIEILRNNPVVEGISVNVTGGLMMYPMEPISETCDMFDIVEKVRSDLGLKCRMIESGGSSDANRTAYLGIPTLDGFGPVGFNGHSNKEFMDISSVKSCIETATGFMDIIAAEK